MPVRHAERRTASSPSQYCLGSSWRSMWRSVSAEPERFGILVKSARTVTFPGAVSFGHTLAPLRRGPGDPCFRLPGDGTMWRTSLLSADPSPRGSAARPPTPLIARRGAAAPRNSSNGCPRCWVPTTTSSDFVPAHPTVAAAHRRVPHLRLGRTGQVLEALIPAIIEQRVPGADAFRSWRVLVTKYGTPAPGPAPAGMRVPPSAQVGETSRRGSFIAPTSTRGARRPWWAVRDGRPRWNGWCRGRRRRRAKR